MQAQLMAALEQLKQAEIPVILTFGNHDYYKKRPLLVFFFQTMFFI